MTSKGLEMLEILKQRNDTLKINHKIGSRDIANQEIKEITQCFDNYVIPVIEKDFEVLEILKRHSTRLDDEDWNDNIFNGIDYENLDEKERKIIKEWLEHE